ncbi:hypothetical protein HDU97_009984 [Phlyctochytrium planicorne]|nr:hypothetical protein HDU97_009984 [Phlyctochytrium planicorne]
MSLVQEIGSWSLANFQTGVVGIHAALLPENRVILYERFHGLHAPSIYPANPFTFVERIGQSEVSAEVDLDLGKFEPKHADSSPFCSGAAQMANGSILVVGGDGDNVGNGYIKDGRFAIRQYTHESGWVEIGQLHQSRWYPTVTMVDHDRYLIVGGHKESYVPTDPERSNPTLEFWPPHPAGVVHVPILTDTYPFNTYPVVFLLPSGKVFMLAGIRSCILDLSNMTMKELPQLQNPLLEPSRSFPYSSQSVMLPLTPRNNFTATVMICGGTEKSGKASTSCSTIRPDDKNPQWKNIEDMPVPRVMGDLVLLPSKKLYFTFDSTDFVKAGKIVNVNGAKWGTADGPAGFGKSKDPAFEAVLFDPEADESVSPWKVMAGATVPRLYHSTALLLQDGRVATFGSDQQNYADASKDPFEYRIEYFWPPHISDPNRPKLIKAPNELKCGQVFEVEYSIPKGNVAGDIKVVLIRYGTATHSTNMDSRLVELVSPPEMNRLLVQAPANGNIAPSGNWMLFVVNGNLPSVGLTLLCTAWREKEEDDEKRMSDIADQATSPMIGPGSPAVVEKGITGAGLTLAFWAFSVAMYWSRKKVWKLAARAAILTTIQAVTGLICFTGWVFYRRIFLPDYFILCVVDFFRALLIFLVFRFNHLKLLGRIKDEKDHKKDSKQDTQIGENIFVFQSDTESQSSQRTSVVEQNAAATAGEVAETEAEKSSKKGCGGMLLRFTDRFLEKKRKVPTEREPAAALAISHITSVVVPVIEVTLKENRSSARRLKLSYESFKEMLEDENLFLSFKEYTAADLTLENAVFLEAYKELINQYEKAVQKRMQEKRRSSRKPHQAWISKGLSSIRSSTGPMEKGFLGVTSIGEMSEDSIPAQEEKIDTQKSSMCSDIEETQNDQSLAYRVPSSVKRDYIAFYHMYIEEGGMNEVNLSANVRNKIRKVYISGKWKKDDLLPAKEEVMMILFLNSYPRWFEDRKKKQGNLEDGVSNTDIPPESS